MSGARGRARSVLALLAVLFGCLSSARAHPTPGSLAYVDFTVDGARIEQDVPLEELERALKQSLIKKGESPEQSVDRQRELLRAYAARHLTASSDSKSWQTTVLDVRGHAADDGPRVLIRFALVAAEGTASRSLRLHDDLVTHEVVSHYLTVYVRSDWSQGPMGELRLVGVLRTGRGDLTVTRAGSFWRGFRSIVELGGEHITSGTDHLLFLFALVLVAPVEGPRWKLRRDTRGACRQLAAVVTAFTVGHSATLALASLGLVGLPSALVEAAIAASVLITALHALRPLFPRREAWVAGLFGLVHGLAFADTLTERDLGRAQAAWTLLGFNLGIELAQLALLFLTVPWLLVLARTRVYDAVRWTCGVATAVLACGWLLERTVGSSNPTEDVVSWLEAHALSLLLALAATALIARLWDTRAGFRTAMTDHRAR